MPCVEIISNCFNCQKKDWPLHREECKGLAGLEAMDIDNTAKSDYVDGVNGVRLLVRAIVSPQWVSRIYYV